MLIGYYFETFGRSRFILKMVALVFAAGMSWSLSNTLEIGFYIDAFRWRLSSGQPEIINSDRVRQFANDDWPDFLKE